MATYRQTIKHYEDGYGEITLDLILSDTYADIFGTTFTNVEGMQPDSTEFVKESALSYISQDSATLIIDQSTFENSDDEAMLTLAKSSDTQRVYYAMFLNLNGADPISSKLLYLGIVDPEFEVKDYVWKGNQWGESPTPISEYKFKIAPYGESILDGRIPLEHIIEGSDDPMYGEAGFPKLDVSPLIASDRVAFTSRTIILKTYRSYHARLIPLGRLLAILAEQQRIALLQSGIADINISFANCNLDGKFYPVRWTKRADGLSQAFLNVTEKGASVTHTRIWEILDDDGFERNLITDSYLDTDNLIYVNLNAVSPLETVDKKHREYNTEIAKESAWHKNPRVNNSFTNLLYCIATELGLDLKIVLVDPNNIQIRFSPKSNVPATKVYIKDVKGAKLKKKRKASEEDSKLLFGMASYHMQEGLWSRVRMNSSGGLNTAETAIGLDSLSEGRDLTLLTIGPSTVQYNVGDLSKHSSYKSRFKQVTKGDRYVAVPYNLYQTENGNVISGSKLFFNTTSQHNNLYIRVPKRTGEIKTLEDNYWTTVGAYQVDINGKTETFNTIADFVNSSRQNEDSEFSKTYDIDLPYIMAGSTSSDGSSPSLFHLFTGNVLTLDTQDYVINKCKVDWKSWGVKLEIVSTARYNYEVPSGPIGFESTTEGDSEDASESIAGNIENEIVGGLTAQGNISKNDIVSYVDNETVTKSENNDNHINIIYGISLSDALDGETLDVIIRGTITIPSLGGTNGDLLFLRDGSPNYSFSPLLEKTETENLYAPIGRIIEADTFELVIHKERYVVK